MALCFLSIGSNVERERHVRGALHTLHEHFGPLLLSSVYETRAVGFDGAPFFNLVAGFFCTRTPSDIVATLVGIETSHGRVRGGERFGPRTLDLDLLLYGEHVVRETNLTLPRPELLKYGFMLEPLAEIAGDLPYPELGETYAALWHNLPAAHPGTRRPLCWTIDTR